MKKKLIKVIFLVPISVIGILILLNNKTISNKPSELIDPKAKEEAQQVLKYPKDSKETTNSVQEQP